jgi:hypothetical protein
VDRAIIEWQRKLFSGRFVDDTLGVQLLIYFHNRQGQDYGYFFLGPAHDPKVEARNDFSKRWCGLNKPLPAPDLGFLRDIAGEVLSLHDDRLR